MNGFLKGHNTLPFAIGHLSRGVVVGVVALLYGISKEADQIFTAYYIIGLPMGVGALTMQFSISHMRAAWSILVPLMISGAVLVAIIAGVAYFLTGNPYLLLLAPWGVIALLGVILYGINAACGNLAVIPRAQVFGAALLVGVGVPAGMETQGVATSAALVSAVFAGECWYVWLLQRGIGPDQLAQFTSDWKTLLRQLARQLPKALALGLAVPVLRLCGGFFGEGWVGIFTYVSVIAISGFVVLTAGYRATSGWRKAQQIP